MATLPAAPTEQHALTNIDDQDKATASHSPSELEAASTSIVEPSAAQTDVRTVTGWRWVFVCLGLYCAIFLYGLDNTIAADIQGAIVATYGDVSQLAWIGIGFPLGSIATILTFGKAYGMFNIKWLHIGSIVVFLVGSALCGAAPNMNALIVGRVIAGAGGAGLYLGMLNLIAVNTTEKERPAYIGGTGVVWGVGTILGPVIGGSFADSSATWRWAFYINLVILAVLTPALLGIPSFNPQPQVSAITKLKELDWVGAVLNAGLFTSFIMALTFGGVNWPWNDGRTIATLVVCVVILLLFAAQQYFAIFTTPARRLFPIQFITNRTMVLAHICVACSNTAMFVVIYYIPLVFQFSRGDNGVESAVRLLPFIIPVSVCIMASGQLLGVIGYYFLFYVFGGVMILIGGSLMYTVRAGTSIGAIYAFEVLLAIGAGLTAQISYNIGPHEVPADDMSAAISFINVGQIGGLVLALTISGTIFQNITYLRLYSLLSPYGFPDQEIRGAVAGSQSAAFAQLTPELRGQAIEVIVKSISDIYGLVIAAGALCIVGGLLFKKERIRNVTAVAAG